MTNQGDTPIPQTIVADSTLAHMSAQAPEPEIIAEKWLDNPKYFQTGKKAGKLKPVKSTEFAGLQTDDLHVTQSITSNSSQAAPVPDKKALIQERKKSDATTGAKLAMRLLDVVTGWISGNTYGNGFDAAQRAERNRYRDELEEDWRTYLMTLDIPLHPALIVAFGSATYIAPAFQTPKGEERVKTWKEKLIGKVVSKIVS